MLEIKVLGPLEASANGRSVLPTAGKPRQMLALLALHAGEVVPISTLTEEVWRDNPPRSAISTLQTYVLQIRRQISQALDAAAAKHILVTRPTGYMLAQSAISVDASSYHAMADRANAAYQAGDYARAAEAAREALRLWSGPMLVDVQRGMPLDIEVSWHEQSRLSMLVTALESELALGRHQMLLGELAMIVARNPLHENLTAIYMLALYRSGQQSRSLEMYSQLRNHLSHRLGVEPSARLRLLQRAILSSDPSLELAPMPTPVPAGAQATRALTPVRGRSSGRPRSPQQSPVSAVSAPTRISAPLAEAL